MPKQRDGKEVKKAYSVRLEPSVYEKIVQEFGSFSDFVNQKIREENKKGESYKEFVKRKKCEK